MSETPPPLDSDNPTTDTSQPHGDLEETDNMPVTVALGASAGGIEQLSIFFGAVEDQTGAAFVVIEHLHPDSNSMLPHILARSTKMRVRSIEDGMKLAPNQIHVAPPGLTITLEKDVLHTRNFDSHQGIRTPIDGFFRSLARARGQHCIGIVLSGSGSDGALGLKAIKAQGGLTLVQTPSTASFSSMPRTAAETARADYLLDTDKIAMAVSRFLRRGTRTDSLQKPEPALSVQQLNRLLQIVHTHTSHDFRHYKEAMLLRRVARRIKLSHAADIDAYAQLLDTDAEERQQLCQDLLISVTDFFREPKSYDIIEREIIPTLLQRENHKEDTLRVWVPGCATGEEAYSLAMLIDEQLYAKEDKREFQIFASDIDEHALDTARGGVYPETIGNDVSPERLRSFFTRLDHRYRLERSLRERVVVAKHDLLRDPPYSNLDLISCRNLLIYLNADTQKRLIATFHFSLREGGFLFLGNSENIGEQVDLFEPVSKEHRIYRRIGPRRREKVDLPVRYAKGGPIAEREEAAGKSFSHASELTRELLLQEYVPATVVINRKMEILCAYGPTQKYFTLPFGESSLDLMKMARPNVRNKLRAVIHKAMRENDRISIHGADTSSKNKHSPLSITARPFFQPESARGLLLLTIEESPALNTLELRDVAQGDAEKQLAEELQATRTELHSTVQALEDSNEELKGYNEEVISMNEELQSTNEDLETSKEELQSLNEELTTVNSELQEKIRQLEAAHDDLANLFAGSRVATLFLDRALRIKRFTPAVKKLLNVIDSDIGRPLRDITLNVDDPTLFEDADAVLADLSLREREVEGKKGQWFLRRMLPYRTRANVIQGVVATFTDITEIKSAAVAVARSEERLNMAVAGIRGGMWDQRLNPEDPGQLPDEMYLSPRLKALLGFTDNELPNSRQAWEARILPEDRDAYRQAAARNVVAESDVAPAIEYRTRHRDGQVCWLSSRGKVIRNEENRPIRWIGIDHDITAIKQANLAARRREEQLRLLADSLPALIAYVDSGERYRFNNAAYGEWYGTEVADIQGRRVAEFIPEHVYADVKPHIDSVLNGRSVSFETTLPHVQLGPRSVQVSFIPHSDDTGKVMGFYALISDVTETKRQQHISLGRQADISNIHRTTTMGEMATSLAHELNQPLGAITSYVGGLIRMLRTDVEREKIIPIIQKIAEQSKRAGDIVKNVREFVERDENQHLLIDLNELLRKSLSLSEGRVQQIGVTVRLHVAADLPPVMAESVQLEQVLINLITNALEAMTSVTGPRELTVRSSVREEQVEIAVQDTGSGIAADRLSWIFDPFHTTKENGMGMGLSISRSIVEAHGGRLWAESQSGRGATFFVRLPIATETDMAQDEDKPAEGGNAE